MRFSQSGGCRPTSCGGDEIHAHDKAKVKPDGQRRWMGHFHRRSRLEAQGATKQNTQYEQMFIFTSEGEEVTATSPTAPPILAPPKRCSAFPPPSSANTTSDTALRSESIPPQKLTRATCWRAAFACGNTTGRVRRDAENHDRHKVGTRYAGRMCTVHRALTKNKIGISAPSFLYHRITSTTAGAVPTPPLGTL